MDGSLRHRAREHAKAFIRPYVERGDGYDWYRSVSPGHWGGGYRASVGGGWGACQCRSTHEIAVTMVGGVECCFRFRLRELWHELNAGVTQPPLF